MTSQDLIKARRDFEFKSKALAELRAEGLPHGLCLGSKSGYRRSHRRHFFIPNANVFCRPGGKVWWGDLDLWRQASQLEQVAKRLRCRLYVLHELPGRFENENLPFEDVRRVAVWHTGGRRHLDRRLIERLGIPLRELAALVGVSVQQLAEPQIPYVAQKIEQRLRDWDDSVGAFTRELGFKKFGDWLLKPNAKLAGRSPFQVLRTGEDGKNFHFENVFEEIITDEKRFKKLFDAWLRVGDLRPGTISLEWPQSERPLHHHKRHEAT